MPLWVVSFVSVQVQVRTSVVVLRCLRQRLELRLFLTEVHFDSYTTFPSAQPKFIYQETLLVITVWSTIDKYFPFQTCLRVTSQQCVCKANFRCKWATSLISFSLASHVSGEYTGGFESRPRPARGVSCGSSKNPGQKLSGRIRPKVIWSTANHFHCNPDVFLIYHVTPQVVYTYRQSTILSMTNHSKNAVIAIETSIYPILHLLIKHTQTQISFLPT